MRNWGSAWLVVLCGCVSDSPIVDGGGGTDSPAGDTSMTGDTGVDSGGMMDAGADAKEAEAPCGDAAAVMIPNNQGPQCDPKGGMSFCASISECCGTPDAGLVCNAKMSGCGTFTTFECDDAVQCGGGKACCLRNGVLSQMCPNRVNASQGTYCGNPSCVASDIPICNGASCLMGKKCTNLQLVDFPGKILSGCL